MVHPQEYGYKISALRSEVINIHMGSLLIGEFAYRIVSLTSA